MGAVRSQFSSVETSPATEQPISLRFVSDLRLFLRHQLAFLSFGTQSQSINTTTTTTKWNKGKPGINLKYFSEEMFDDVIKINETSFCDFFLHVFFRKRKTQKRRKINSLMNFFSTPATCVEFRILERNKKSFPLLSYIKSLLVAVGVVNDELYLKKIRNRFTWWNSKSIKSVDC